MGSHSIPDVRYSRRRFTGMMVGAAASTSLITGRARHLRGRDDGESFLREQARRLIDSALLRADDAGNKTGVDLRVPGGNMGYPAFWIRDAVMMLGGDFIGAAELEGWIRLICSTIRGPVDLVVRSGVVVPAYSVADHINFDGRATFYPGSYETGRRQGGPPWGKYPPLDDGFFFVRAVREHDRLAPGVGIFRKQVRTAFGETTLSDLCERVFACAPCDPETGLVTAGDIDTENAKDWGFCDTVSKSGSLLFPSVLKFRAAGALAEMFDASGDKDRAERFRDDAERISRAIASSFLHSAPDPAEAWLHSATGVGDQADVWGSALAVHCGAIRGDSAAAVSRAMSRAVRERTAVRSGLVRHLLTTDPVNGGHWERSVAAPGEYQNGGYWSTPTGWVISAVHRTDPALAAGIASDFLGFLRTHMRDDGMTEAWEWVNEDTGRKANPLYVASVALPYLSLREAGLLALLHRV